MVSSSKLRFPLISPEPSPTRMAFSQQPPFSFDTKGGTQLPRIEIYGTEASLSVPDPNRFDGPVSLKEKGAAEWKEIPHTHKHYIGRGLGLADMASAIRSGRPHRASGDLAFHVLDIMLAFHESAELKQTVSLQSSCQRPAPLPTGSSAGKDRLRRRSKHTVRERTESRQAGSNEEK